MKMQTEANIFHLSNQQIFKKLEYKILILMGVERSKKVSKSNLKRRIRSPKIIYTFDLALLHVGNFSKEII